MAERPILFSSPLVLAILDGRKTETRRLVTPATSRMVKETRTAWNGLDWSSASVNSKPGPYVDWHGGRVWAQLGLLVPHSDAIVHGVASKTAPGDVLWVRETWQPIGGNLTGPEGVTVRYGADGRPRTCAGASVAWRVARMGKYGQNWCRVGGINKGMWPAIHMPKWASRIRLRVTDVRAERLQEIDGNGARAEGVQSVRGSAFGDFLRCPDEHDVANFALLWDSIYSGEHAWSANPWVWRIRFEVMT